MTARGRLTGQQRSVLEYLSVSGETGGPQLAALLHTSESGVHRTASSLIRRGLIKRGILRGRVYYWLSAEGRHRIGEA